MGGMRYMLLSSPFLIKAAEAATATGTVTTEYADAKFPVIQIITLILAIVIMLAVSVYGIVFIVQRGTNWTYSLMPIMFFCLLFNYVPIYALQFIKPVVDFAASHPSAWKIISVSISVILEVVSIFVATRVVVGQSQKRGYHIDITTALLFGPVYFIAAILILDQIMGCFTWLVYGTTLNSMGFDAFVETLMNANELTEKEAVEAALRIIDAPPFDCIWDTLAMAAELLTRCAIGVVFYGYFTREIEKPYLFYGFGFQLLEYIACLILSVFNLTSIFNLLLKAIVAAICCFLVYTQLLKGPMSADMYTLTHKKERKKPKTTKGADPNQKMPTINMPKD